MVVQRTVTSHGQRDDISSEAIVLPKCGLALRRIAHFDSITRCHRVARYERCRMLIHPGLAHFDQLPYGLLGLPITAISLNV